MIRHTTRTIPLTLLVAAAILAAGCRELTELRSISALQENQISELRKSLETERDKHHRYATTSSSEIEALKSRIENQSRELRKAQSDRAESERRQVGQLKALRAQLAQTKADLAKARKSSEALSSKAADRAIEAENQAARAAKLQQNLEATQRGSQQERERANTLEMKLEEANKDLKKKTDDLTETRKKLEKATERAERLEASTKNLSTQIANLQEAMNETSSSKTEVVEDLRKEAARMQQQIQRMEQGELVMDADFRDALSLFKASLKPLSEADYASVTTDPRGIVVRLTAGYLFKDGVSLDPAVLPTLDQIAEILNRFPRKSIEVQGHTDTEPILNLPYTDNWALAAARAAAVTRYLTDHAGVEPARVKLSSCSQYRPVPAGEKKDPAMDRRVEIILTNRP